MTQQAIEPKKTATKNGQPPTTEDEFVDLVIDRPSFKPESFTARKEGSDREVYTGAPVQGYVIAHASMGQVKDDEAPDGSREAFAYVVKLTSPVKVKDRQGDVIEAKPGDEIYVWESAQLRQALPPTAANHPGFCLHVRLTPKFRAPIPGKKQKLWHWEFKLAKPKPRGQIASGANLIAQLLATAPQPTALPAGGETSDGDLPF